MWKDKYFVEVFIVKEEEEKKSQSSHLWISSNLFDKKITNFKYLIL